MTSRRSNLDATGWSEEYAATPSVMLRRIANEPGAKASLLATAGPNVERGVILSGYSDVMPVDNASRLA